MTRRADVAVVGAGVVGAAVARALSHHRLDVVLLEANGDVGAGTSKANTAILHTGFDATPGTIESRLVRRGYELLGDYASRVGIAVERLGGLLVAWDDDQMAALPRLAEKAAANGYRDTRIVGRDELVRREPNLGAGALGALEVPGEAIIDPWSPVIAFTTEAVMNGVDLRRNTAVTSATRGDPHVLHTNAGDVEARFVVNAAGLNSDELDRAFGFRRFTVTARRGELIVFDKLARPLLSHIILPVPTSVTKGVLISPTVFGNVMLGPTAEDRPDKTDTSSSAAGLASLLEKGHRILPALVDEEVTAVYSGLRAATEFGDYQIHIDDRYLCIGGIRSTGLTASMAIAEEALALLAEAGLRLERKSDVREPVMANLGEAGSRPYQSGGRVVCLCERVTEDEIRGALVSTVPPVDLDGLRRRTRTLMGRCQGFHCLAEVRTLTGYER